MAVSSLAFGAAQVPSFICSLSRQKGCTRETVVFRAQQLPLPFSFSSRKRLGRLVVPSPRFLQSSSPKYGTMLMAGTESEHLGVLNVLKPAGEEEPQVVSLPDPTHQATTGPHHSSETASSSSAQNPSPQTPQETAPPQDEAQQERIADGANAGPSGQEELLEDDDEVSDKQMYGSRTIREVCEKLIEVFMVEKPEVMDWKRLLTLSSEWANIRPKFYTHIKKRAKEVEEDGNHEYALQLYSLQRRLYKVEEEMARYDQLLAEVEAETDWNSMVVRRREEFSQDFFLHIRMKADSQFNELGRRDELVNLSAKLMTALQVHDNIQNDEALMIKAEEKFLNLLDSPDLTTLDSRIDNLAQTGGLDPALLLTMSKAWVAAKDSSMVKDEVKDIMAHMYWKAQQSQQMYLPKEVRILRYLLTIEDPQERYRALEEAFEPGDESDPFDQGETALLYTTPEKLYDLVSSILVAYFTGAKASTMLKEAAALMRPKVIDRIKLLKDMIQKDFL